MKKNPSAADPGTAETQAAILNAIPAHIALLDAQGVILVVNESWKRFASANVLQSPAFSVGCNYLEVCERAPGDCSGEAAEAGRGLRRVLQGELREFALEYPCHSPHEQRWFRLMVTPVSEERRAGAVVMHINITERRLAEDAVRASEARLIAAQSVAKTGSWETDLATFAVRWSAESHRIFETDPAIFVPTHATFLELVHPADRAAVDRAFQQSLATCGAHAIEHRLLLAGGRIKFVEERWQVYCDEAARPLRAIGTCQDITERKRAEGEIFRANRALQMLSTSNEKLIRAQDESVLLPEICHIAVELGGYRMAWVGYAQEDEGQSITPVAHAGVEEGYLTAIKLSWRKDEPHGQGPAGRTIRSGEAVVYEDFTAETAFGPWQILAQQRGYRGGICLPLREAARTFGVFALYTAEPTKISAEEMKLLQDLADNLAFGILNLRERHKRKLTQEALRASETEFHLLTEAMPQIVWVTRADGWNIYFNRRWMDYTGLTQEESLGHGWNKPFHPDDQQRARAAWQQATATGGIYSLECRLRRADGVYHWWLVRGVPQLGPTGEILKWFGTCTDIDESKRVQVRIAEQAALIDQARDAIIVRDLEDRVTFWNKGAERLYGWTAAEAVGRTILELLKPELEKFHEALGLVRREGLWNGEIQKSKQNGAALTIDGRWTLLRDDEGRPKSILCIDTDITEWKKLEQQFLRAQRLESIGTLAGGIAHDLNNLLAPIIMGVGLLKLFEPNPKSLPVIENIERSAQRAASLVKQVLSFARGVEGARVTLQVRHIVKEVESIAENTFPKNITIKTHVAPDLGLILADPTQLNQVLLNLCVNARDSMPDGGRLKLTASNTEIDQQYAIMSRGVVPGRFVEIEVTDNGSGMPPEIIDRIFEPFFTTKELGKGTGLGLSTVLGIVRSHGGFVNVYSELGKGSTFKVYLPVQAEGQPADATSRTEDQLPRGNGELIMVVDDESSVRDITTQTLQTFGYRVVSAENGAHAIGLYALQRDKVALVITDMMMPVMDGPSLIAALRRINPQVRVIAASGLTANANVARVAIAGVTDFLAKPYSADALLRLIRKALTQTISRPPM